MCNLNTAQVPQQRQGGGGQPSDFATALRQQGQQQVAASQMGRLQVCTVTAHQPLLAFSPWTRDAMPADDLSSACCRARKGPDPRGTRAVPLVPMGRRAARGTWGCHRVRDSRGPTWRSAGWRQGPQCRRCITTCVLMRRTTRGCAIPTSNRCAFWHAHLRCPQDATHVLWDVF